MSSLPIITQEKFMLKFNELKCFEHKNNPIVGICNDKNCKNKTKYMCLDCIFDKHSGHVGIKSNIIEDIYNKKIDNDLKQKGKLKVEYDNFERNLRNKINEMKDTINKILDEFYQKILKEIKKDKNLDICEEINLINKNYPPKNEEQLNILIEELLKLYNNENSNIINNNILNEKEFSYYEDEIRLKFISLESYLKQFLIFEDEKISEWSTKTYGNYGFYYKLEDNNSKVTKISNDGTITICRGKFPLKINNKYKLEYFINYLGGDFDVGFGDEEVGPSCWIRGKKSYCISSNGFYKEGILVESNKNLIKAKMITFIIDLKQNNADILLDEQKKYSINIRTDSIYYPMIAFRELNNSAKFKLTKLN